MDVLQANDFPKGTGRTGLSISWPDIARRLELAPFLSIASIRGRARGLGSEFIQAFDIRFASMKKAFLAQVEIGIGSYSEKGGMERLPLLIGRSRALDIASGWLGQSLCFWFAECSATQVADERAPSVKPRRSQQVLKR